MKGEMNMKQSIWLQNYEKAVNAKRGESNQKKKIILIIIPMMMVLGLIAAMAGGGMDDPQAQSGMLAFIGVFVGIMLFVVLMISIGKKKDVTKQTRNEVMALFRSDYDVDQFDQEMSAPPIKEIAISSETTMFLTENYIGVKFMSLGDLHYSFIRKHDAASFHKKKTGSTTGNPLNAAFFFDIRNAEQKVIMNGLADSGKQLDAIVELLQMAKPDVILA